MDSRKRVAIITSGHQTFDDRIFWKFGKSLSDIYDVRIITSLEKIETTKDNIQLIGFIDYKSSWEKIDKFLNYLNDFKPDLVICEEPMTVFAARKLRRLNNNVKIVLDVTEWYPENVSFKLKGFKKVHTYLGLSILNFISSNLCDWIIIGERGKKRRYDIIAPLKNKTIIGYYPILEYFKYAPPKKIEDKITLCYAGVITFERGIIQLINASILIAKRHPKLKVELVIAGKFSYDDEENQFRKLVDTQNEVKITFKRWIDYDKISDLIKDADICFDLRKRNFIYRNSLPIKIFEYMACGKPFIYSDINPIRKELKKIECGFLVDPNDKMEIVKIIELYIADTSLLLSHSEKARQLIEKDKNWEKESIKLTKLVERLLK